MKENFADSFFHYASKIIVGIAVGVVVLGLILRFNKKSEQVVSLKTNITSIPQPTQPLLTVQKTATDSVQFNLEGPMVCTISSKESTVSAYIKNKSVYVEQKNQKQTSSFLLNGDCLYSWQQGVYSGEKTCGVGQYVSLFSTISSFHLGDQNMIQTILPQLSSVLPTGVSPESIQKLFSSCKKEEIKDLRIFDIPKQVLFKNKEK